MPYEPNIIATYDHTTAGVPAGETYVCEVDQRSGNTNGRAWSFKKANFYRPFLGKDGNWGKGYGLDINDKKIQNFVQVLNWLIANHTNMGVQLQMVPVVPQAVAAPQPQPQATQQQVQTVQATIDEAKANGTVEIPKVVGEDIPF